MKARFDFWTRQAAGVASAVAEEIENNTAYGRCIGEPHPEVGIRPVMLSITGTTFRFEGGIVVKVHLVDVGRFSPADYRVSGVDIRYYRMNPHNLRPVEGEGKRTEVWGVEKLLALKGYRPWWHPHVLDPETDLTQEEYEKYSSNIPLRWGRGIVSNIIRDVPPPTR